MAKALSEDAPDFLTGEKFKSYESDAQSSVDGPFAVLRVDGKGFSRLTKLQGYAVPYDLDFMGIMDQVAHDLLLLIDGSHFAYVQSDEVSVVFGPTGSESAPQWWFGGKLQKLISISAARATLSFAQAEAQRTGDIGGLRAAPLFDSRVISLKSAEEAEEYLRWRRFDAQKNSVSMAVSTLFSHRELQGVSSRERAAKLEGTELERLPEGFFNGRIHYRTKIWAPVWDRYREQYIQILGTKVVSAPADRNFVEQALPSILVERHYSSDEESSP